MSFDVKNLRQVEDLAAKHGFSDTQEARFPRRDLNAESIGLAYLVVRPGKQQPFAHRHENAEEIYVVLSGGGRVKLDGELEEVGPLAAIRIAPSVIRAFEAGNDDLVLLVFSPRAEGDAEVVQDFSWD